MERNQTEQPDERLSDRLAELTEINQPWQHSPERLYQITHEMYLISFEQQMRYKETHPDEHLIEEIKSIKTPKGMK